MKYYIQTDQDGYITDLINYPYENYQEIEYAHALPTGVYNTCWKWNGTGFEFDEVKYAKTDSGEAEMLASKVKDLENENKILNAQVNALSTTTDFHEDLIAEMAMLVYA